MNGASESRRPRRWPLAVIAILAAVSLAWIWLASGLILQLQVIATYATVLLSGTLLLIWLLFLSRLPLRARLVPVAALAVVGLLVAATVRVRGVTGDWLPVLEWRYAERPDWSAAPPTRPAASTAVAETAEAEPAEPVAEPDAVAVAESDPDASPTTDAVTAPVDVTEEEAAEPQVAAVDLSSPAAFPGFLGPDRDSTLSGVGLARDWEAQPPQLLWERQVGTGWAGFAVADGIAYTLEQRGDLETTVAYDLMSGNELWTAGDPVHFSSPIGGPGPRTTPAIGPERIFTFGATGLLTARDRLSGELLWQRDVIDEHGAKVPEHGKTSSPLLVDGLVVVSAGGPNGHSLVAYDQQTGEPAWQAGDDASGYGSPVVATLAGRRQILIFNAASVAGHAIADGSLLWQHSWPANWPNVAPPVVIDDERVLFSTGYGIGSKLLRVEAGADGTLGAELVWESPRLKAKFTNLVLYRDYVYGLDDGVLVCLDPETGERMWKSGRYGHGSILLVDDLLLVQTERGDLVMLDPTPEEARELGRFTALKGKAWNHFALVKLDKPYLLVRNDERAALWELPLANTYS